MNHARGWARRVASRKHPSRRALFVESLEDRSLMAADLLPPDSAFNLLTAEGEAGSSLPNKVSYTLQILDANGNALTNGSNRTASIRKDSDFYLQLVGQDIRPNGKDPVTGSNLVRGVFAAYTDILYDKTFATIAANETQRIFIGGASQTGTFTLTLPANPSGKSGTTASISFNKADDAGTAKNIQDALNTTLFGSATAKGVKVVYDSGINVTFVGINNVSLPLMTSNSGDVAINEILDGAPSNTLAAVEYERDSTTGFVRYSTDHSASDAPFGIDDIGGFTLVSAGLGSTALPVLRIHMIASAPSPQIITFAPDPLGDGSSSADDMLRPRHNSLVYGNNNVKDPSGEIDPDTGDVKVAELEQSLVKFAPTNNEFLNLTGVTLSISNPVYTAVPDTGYSVNANHTAGVNSVTIPVLANDTITGAPGTPVKEIKSFDATTTGGTIAKVGDNLVFTPSVDFTGTATFTYKGGIVGDNVTTATGTVTVSVVELPKKVSYTLEILDASGNPLTNSTTRTATLSTGADFYVQFVGQDTRPAGIDPVTGNPLVRGVYASYTDILFDKNFATIAANEKQSIRYDGLSDTGTFTLTLPANASGKSGTTAPISFNRNDDAGTAKNIQDALNAALFGTTTANGVKVVTNLGRFDVTFVGINNVSLPLLTSNSSDFTIAEIFDGATANMLAAVQYELDANGVERYGSGRVASQASFGIDDIGGITNSTAGLGRNALPILRIHMIAAGLSPQPVTFTPDPLGDGSGSPDDMLRPDHNTLVFGNRNVKDPSGQIDPITGEVKTAEIENSLVQFAPTGNEFLNLTGVTLSIGNPLYQAVPDTGFSVKENHTAGENSVTIPVLANDATSVPGTPVKEIKSFDTNTTGGTITKVGDNLVFTPSVDFSGTATFTYKGGIVGDNSTGTTGTVTVSVAPVNRAPTCTVGPGQHANDEQGLQTVTGWLKDCSANDPGQTVSFTVATDNTALFTVVPTVDATGKLSFDPAPNKEGTAKVTVTLQDDGGTANGGVDQTKIELQFDVIKLHQYFNAAETGERRGLDVTGSSSLAPDGKIVAADALAIINYINATGGGKVPDGAPAGPPYCDVNGDGRVVGEDVLIVINYINAHASAEGEALSATDDPSSTDNLLLLLATDLATQSKRSRRG